MKRFVCLVLAVTLCFSVFFAKADESPIKSVVSILMDPSHAQKLYDSFTPEMKAAAPAESLPLLWQQLTAIGGEFVALIDDECMKEQSGYQVYSRTLDMTALDLLCTLSLDSEKHIAGLSFTPAPKQYPAQSSTAGGVCTEEVVVGDEPWQLGGALTLPENIDGPVPGVVLVHGSGASDRDESVSAVKPFRDLAEMLSQRGIAVLRYDKRTYTYGKEIASSTEYTSFNVEEETIQDAIAAAKLLASDERIDSSRIYVLGHSLGAMLAPRIIDESKGLFNGMILACGSNQSLLDIMLRQSEDAVAAIEDETARLQGMQQLSAAREEISAMLLLPEVEVRKTTILGQPAYYFWEMLQHPTAAEYMQQLQRPTLIINGSRDFQINEAEGRMTWEQVLDLDAPWLNVYWADVNHMLMKPEVDASMAGTALEYSVACQVDSDVIETIVNFIQTTEETNQ